MEGFIPLFIILFIGFVIVSIVMGNIRARERRKMLAALAAELGLHYSADKRYGMEDDYPNLGIFRRGSNRYAQNFITGAWEGSGLHCFDYHYQVTSGSGKNRRTTHYRYTVVMLRPAFPLKPLEIRTEGLWDKFTSMFGWDDIDFESAEFSRRFHVSAPDRRWAYDVITPRTMEFLMERNEDTLCMDGEQLMVLVRGWQGREAMLHALETGKGLLERIPRFAREGPV